MRGTVATGTKTRASPCPSYSRRSTPRWPRRSSASPPSTRCIPQLNGVETAPRQALQRRLGLRADCPVASVCCPPCHRSLRRSSACSWSSSRGRPARARCISVVSLVGHSCDQAAAAMPLRPCHGDPRTQIGLLRRRRPSAVSWFGMTTSRPRHGPLARPRPSTASAAPSVTAVVVRLRR